MHLLRVLLAGLLLLSSYDSTSQQARIDISAKPYNAILLLDGDTLGVADGQRIYVGFNIAKDISSHVIVVTANGYIPFVDTLKVEMPKAVEFDVKLERKLPSLKGTPEYTIGFKELVSGLEYGTQLSPSYRWKYKFDEHIDLSKRVEKIHQALNDIGFKTIDKESSDVPDVLIKARVEAYSIKKNPSYEAAGVKAMDYTSMMMVHWQFYDRHNNRTVCRQSMTSSFDYDFEYRQDALFNAIIDNFYLLFNTHKEVLDSLQQFDPKRAVELHKRSSEPVEKENVEHDSIARSSDSTENDSLTTLAPMVIDSQPVLSNIPEDTELFGNRAVISKPTFNPSLSLPKVKDRVNDASVVIQVNGTDIAIGTVVSQNGYVITSFLSTDSDDQVEVVFDNGIRLTAEEVETSETFGISLFKVDASELIAQPIAAVSQNSLPTGAFAMVPIANHKSWTPIDGEIISTTEIEGISALQFSASTTTALKGCALFNYQGEVIGLVNNELGKYADDEFVYAVDAKYLFNVLGIAYE